MLESGSRWLLLAAAALLALAFLSRERVGALQHEAGVRAEQSRKAGIAFTSELEGRFQEDELRLLDERRQLAVRALRWRMAGSIAYVLTLLALLAAWTLRQLARADLQAEVSPLDPGASP